MLFNPLLFGVMLQQLIYPIQDLLALDLAVLSGAVTAIL